MRYYVYISKTKIEMLYDQVINKEKEGSFCGGITLGMFSLESKVNHTASIYNKIDAVIKEIDDIGDIYSDTDYIRGTLTMGWNARNRLNSSSNATYWIGEFWDNDGILNKILLIGSQHHIIGNEKSDDFCYSTSYIDAFFGKPESYTMIDIAGKTLPILLINSERDEMGYSWTLVFGYDTNAGEVIYLDSFSHYGEIMYSQDFSALAFSEWETTEDRGEIGYYTIFDNELQNILLIEWDMTVSKDNNYTSTSAFVNQISESRRMEYLKELKELDFRKIT